MLKEYNSPKWMTKFLIVAGLYNIIWAIITLFYPSLFFDLVGMKQPFFLELWQCIGMMVGVIGIGYLLSAKNPVVHYPIIAVGLLAKIFSTIGFLQAFFISRFTLLAGVQILVNDLIWIVPFVLILKEAFHYHNEVSFQIEDNPNIGFENALKNAQTNLGVNLYEQTFLAPTMVVFLRHFGCTFCREALNDLSEVSNLIEDTGKEVVLVHMIDDDEAQQILNDHQLENVISISDKNQNLYKAFHLDEGNVFQLMGLKVLLKGFLAAIVGGLGIGKVKGNAAQMPGVFMLHKSKIVQSYRHRCAADRPNYVAIASCNIPKFSEANF